MQKLLALLRTQQQQSEISAQTVHPSRPLAAILPSSQAKNLEVKTASPTASREDLRYISFAQALPHLTRLAKEDTFLAALLRLKVSLEQCMRERDDLSDFSVNGKDEQDRCEERLAKEREDFSRNKQNRA